ncbi:MAG: Fe-S protein assembly co-chaperone HscB [Planctomycetota bacterium]
MDPFAVFGMPPSLDVDKAWLEARYLELSRASHPDHHASSGVDAVALLARAAEVNDSYRILRDPWQRAARLVELSAPGVLSRRKTLSPDFLDDALELAERVARTPRASTEAEALRARLDELLAQDWRELQRAVAAGEWDAAATRVHQSRYHDKARRDLSS